MVCTSSFLHRLPPDCALLAPAKPYIVLATHHSRWQLCVAPDVLNCAAPQAQQLYLRLLAGLTGREGAEQLPPAGDAFQLALLAVACQLVAVAHDVVSCLGFYYLLHFRHCCLSPVAIQEGNARLNSHSANKPCSATVGS